MTHVAPRIFRELMDYNPETGVLIWKSRSIRYFQGRKRPASVLRDIWNTKNAGKPALNCKDNHGYLTGSVFKKRQKAHRVAWAIVTGRIPVDFIDHINGDRADNRFCNLREVSQWQNNINRVSQKRSTSKYLGVSRFKSEWNLKKTWRATIKPHDKKVIHIGFFESEIEAAIAFDAAARIHHGEFAKLNFPNEVAQ